MRAILFALISISLHAQNNVMPPETAKNLLKRYLANRNTALTVQPASLLNAFAAFAEHSQNSHNGRVRIPERLFLTLAEAAEYSGLPHAHLRRLMAEGKLEALRTGSGWRIRRTDLERL